MFDLFVVGSNGSSRFLTSKFTNLAGAQQQSARQSGSQAFVLGE